MRSLFFIQEKNPIFGEKRDTTASSALSLGGAILRLGNIEDLFSNTFLLLFLWRSHTKKSGTGAPIYDYKLISIHSGATSAYHVCMLQGRRKKAVWQWSPLDSIQKTAFYREMSKLQSLIETTINTGRLMWFSLLKQCSSHRLHFYPRKPHEALFVEWSLKATFLPKLKLLASAEISLRLWGKEDLDLMRVNTM